MHVVATEPTPLSTGNTQLWATAGCLSSRGRDLPKAQQLSQGRIVWQENVGGMGSRNPPLHLKIHIFSRLACLSSSGFVWVDWCHLRGGSGVLDGTVSVMGPAPELWGSSGKPESCGQGLPVPGSVSNTWLIITSATFSCASCLFLSSVTQKLPGLFSWKFMEAEGESTGQGMVSIRLTNPNTACFVD